MISYPNPKLVPVTLTPRVHHDVEVVLRCRSGRAQVRLDGRAVEVRAGDGLWIAADVETELVTDRDTVIVPSFLGRAPSHLTTAGQRWSLLRPVPAALHAMLAAAEVDTSTLIKVGDGQRRMLHSRIRAAFADPGSDVTAPPPVATTPWIDDETWNMLLWCVRGRATVTIAQGRGAALDTIRLGADQAVVVPAGLAHRARTEPGGILVPVGLGPGHAAHPPSDVSAPGVRCPPAPSGDGPVIDSARLLYLPTRLRSEVAHFSMAQSTDLRPAEWSDDAGFPLPASATDVDLAPSPKGTPPWRVQRVQRALHDDPGHRATLADWATAFGVTPRSVELAFAAHADHTFADWRQQLRMRRAADWLDEGRQAKWVSRRLGFAHTSAFSRAFSRHTGATVREYQADARVGVVQLR